MRPTTAINPKAAYVCQPIPLPLADSLPLPKPPPPPLPAAAEPEALGRLSDSFESVVSSSLKRSGSLDFGLVAADLDAAVGMGVVCAGLMFEISI